MKGAAVWPAERRVLFGDGTALVYGSPMVLQYVLLYCQLYNCVARRVHMASTYTRLSVKCSRQDSHPESLF